MRSLFTYILLLGVRALSQIFFRHVWGWVGEEPEDPWGADIRVCAILHHTSLYEPVFAAVPPRRFMKRIAREGVIPIADKTLRRPIVGRFFRLVAREVVGVTRQRDETWRKVVRQAGPGRMVLLLPEGRMKRPNGLDSEGRPMTVRGGIADLIETAGGGKMLLAYSGGLHHVQAPGELLPRLFKTVRMNLELVDLADYRERILQRRGPDESFRRAVVRDLERRRDVFSPTGARPVGIPNPEELLARSERAEAADDRRETPAGDAEHG